MEQPKLQPQQGKQSFNWYKQVRLPNALLNATVPCHEPMPWEVSQTQAVVNQHRWWSFCTCCHVQHAPASHTPFDAIENPVDY